MLRPLLPYLTVQSVIIHDLPKRFKRDVDAVPNLSDRACDLTGDEGDQLKVFFRDRIVDVATSYRALDVVFQDQPSSPVPGHITDWLASPAMDFVPMSQSIAKYLHSNQNGANSAGILTILDCRLQGRHALAILKLERDEGVRFEPAIVDGERTFSMQQIRDLMFTKKTKVFKLALFCREGESQHAGVVCDEQAATQRGIEVASFFLSTFLGCQLQYEPALSTKNFYDAAKSYIATSIHEPIDRSEALVHLVSEMTSLTPTISPQSYAARHLAEEQSTVFFAKLEEHNVPTAAFAKDTSLLRKTLGRFLAEFETGIQLIADATVYEEKIKMTTLPNGQTAVQFTDTLKDVKAK